MNRPPPPNPKLAQNIVTFSELCFFEIICVVLISRDPYAENSRVAIMGSVTRRTTSHDSSSVSIEPLSLYTTRLILKRNFKWGEVSAVVDRSQTKFLETRYYAACGKIELQYTRLSGFLSFTPNVNTGSLVENPFRACGQRVHSQSLLYSCPGID